MLQDTAFTNLLKCRWQELRLTTLNTTALLNEVDSIAAVLDEAKDRHFFVWPILGVQTWANPSPIPLDYAGEISSMKAWIQQRLAWLDANMPGNCIVAGLPSDKLVQENIMVYPNPFNDKLYVKFNAGRSGTINISLEDVSGRTVLQQSKGVISTGEHEIQISEFSNLSAGVYLLKVQMAENLQVVKVIKE